MDQTIPRSSRLRSDGKHCVSRQSEFHEIATDKASSGKTMAFQYQVLPYHRSDCQEIAACMTKPLVGKVFIEFKAVMNLPDKIELASRSGLGKVKDE